MSALNAVVLLKDRISLHGSKGVLFHKALSDLKISLKAGLYMAKKMLLQSGYSFTISGLPINISDIADVSGKFLTILCTAPLREIWKAFGLEDIGETPLPDSPLFKILELLGRARENGCLQTDLTKAMGMTALHTFIDKSVGLGVTVKRGIIPIPDKDTKFPLKDRRMSPGSSKTTIIHLKRFAEAYDVSADCCLLLSGLTQKEEVHEFIAQVMDEEGVDTVAVNDMAKWLGIPFRSMQYLRTQSVSTEGRGGPEPIKFFEAICNPRTKHGGIHCAKLSWCMRRVAPSAAAAADDDDVEGDAPSDSKQQSSVFPGGAFSMSRNLPLYEHVVASLDLYPGGLSSADINRLTSVGPKAAYKLVVQMSGEFGFPTQKVQVGKQAKYRLFSKNPPARPEVVSLLGDGEMASSAGGAEENSEQRSSGHKRSISETADVEKPAAVAKGQTPSKKAKKRTSLAGLGSGNGNNTVMSDQQLRRMDIILMFLDEVNRLLHTETDTYY